MGSSSLSPLLAYFGLVLNLVKQDCVLKTQKVVMRMKDPKCTAYMWSSGKIVCTGSTSAENSRKSAIKFVRRLNKINIEVSAFCL